MTGFFVRNGTSAGIKPPLKPRPTERWGCACTIERGGELHPAYLKNCPGCGAKRPY